jgi:hypothetical protein
VGVALPASRCDERLGCARAPALRQCAGAADRSHDGGQRSPAIRHRVAQFECGKDQRSGVRPAWKRSSLRKGTRRRPKRDPNLRSPTKSTLPFTAIPMDLLPFSSVKRWRRPCEEGPRVRIPLAPRRVGLSGGVCRDEDGPCLARARELWKQLGSPAEFVHIRFWRSASSRRDVRCRCATSAFTLP